MSVNFRAKLGIRKIGPRSQSAFNKFRPGRGSLSNFLKKQRDKNNEDWSQSDKSCIYNYNASAVVG
jgi:hypothetical protein